MSPGYEPGEETVSPHCDLGNRRQPVNRPEPTVTIVPAAPVISVVMLVHARTTHLLAQRSIAFFDHLSTGV